MERLNKKLWDKGKGGIMEVKDLIEQLGKYDENTMVVVSGYEGGCSEVDTIKKIKINCDVNEAWYYGDHEESDDGNTNAIYIG